MMFSGRLSIIACLILLLAATAHGQKQHAPVRSDIPYGQKLNPQAEEPVFAVCSKQGMRVLVSRDDGKTWRQTFLGTDSLEDGGWHGNFAVYGMAATNGVIGIFSGWGSPGVYIGSDDAVHWSHLNPEGQRPASVWDAAAGNGVMLTSADQWRGFTTSEKDFTEWKQHRVKELLGDGRTHHMICGFSEYENGSFIVVGDNRHVFYSHDNGASWEHSQIPESAGDRQEAVASGEGITVVSFKDRIARTADGGATWTVHESGLKGWGNSWRGLSFVRGEFWLTAKKGSHGRRSKDGIHWQDLPKGTPGGRFVEGESGTLVNVERGRYDIKRSEDGVTWESVFEAPSEDVSWDTTFAVYQRVNRAK